jgi:hypothetical protein
VTGVGRSVLPALLVVLVTGCNATSDDNPKTTTTTAAPRVYAFGPTRRCLLEKGARVAPLRAEEGRLRELAAFAQKSSFAVRLDGRTVAMAFGNAGLLAELLTVPDNPYELEVHDNVLMMYLQQARAQARTVQSCLRD